jgi:hypothetical protein
MKTIDKLAEQFKREGHGDEAWALVNVDRLMREYAYTKDPLTKDAEQLGADLRDLVAEWKSVTELPPPQRERKTERESKWEVVWRNELIAVCDALADVLNISTCPRVGWQECVRLIKERLSKQPAAPVAPDGKTVVQSPNNGTYFEPLLNCPFCGKKAVINNEDCSVDCSGCTASTFAQDFVEQAVRQWNKRQPAVEGKRNSCDGCEYDNGPHLTPCNSCCDGEIRLNYKPIKPYPSCEKLRAENDKLMDQLRNAEDYIKELNQPKGE